MKIQTFRKFLVTQAIILPYILFFALIAVGGVAGFILGSICLSFLGLVISLATNTKYLVMICFVVTVVTWCIGWKYSDWTWKVLASAAFAFWLIQLFLSNANTRQKLNRP